MKKPDRRTLSRLATAVLTALILSLTWGTAMGQDETADEDEFLLEEIVVTAEFREKQIQDTPLSITAVTSDTLEARNQIRVDQIAAEAPNVSLQPAGASAGSSLIAFIRGIGQTDFNPSVEPGVGVYVDDVYYATITGNLLDLLDLERVEILRGPQGTLAGRNAIGGAIKLFSRKPKGDNSGFFQATVGSYNRMDVRGAADFAVTDNLFVRIAGTSRSRDGYVNRYDYACRNNTPNYGSPNGYPTHVENGANCKLGEEGGQNMTAGRFSLRWVPTDKFEVNFAANIVNDNSEATPFVLIEAPDTLDGLTSVPIFFDNDGDGAFTSGDIPYGAQFIPPSGSYYNYSTYMDDGISTPNPNFQGGNPGQDIAAYKPTAVPPINNLESKDYTLSLNWNLTDNLSLLSVTSHREYLNAFGDDSDGSPISVVQLLQRMDHEQFTQELRLSASLWDGFADLTLGGFYLDAETNEDARVTLNYAAFDFLHGPDIVPSESKAGYGQLSLHLSDRADLTVGMRYTEDEKSYEFHRHNPDGTLPDPPMGFPFGAGQPANNLVAGLDGLGVSYSSDRFDYRVAFDYDITENVMLYAQLATGYKAGGNNARPFYPSQIHAFDPEELTNYEVGMKSTLWNQLRLNASAFFNDYTDIQLPLTTCFWAPTEPVNEQLPCATQENIGDAEVKGVEVEANWRPTRNFALDLSFAWIDFEYSSLELTQVTPDSIAPFTPELKWSLGAQYRIDLGDMGDLTPRIDVKWQDDVFTTTLNDELNKIDAYYLVNGRLSWFSKDAKWQAALEATNLTDEYYFLTVSTATSYAVTAGLPARPREFAFSIKRVWYFN